MSSSGHLGTWEVVGYEPCQEKTCIKGIRFRLDSNGDVSWFVPEELKSVPLFNCAIYDMSTSTCQDASTLRFGEYLGHIIEFKCDQRKPKDTMILRADALFQLYCKRAPEEPRETAHEIPFNLLNALEEGYFSDITITSENNRQFHVHSLVLNIIGPNIDWHSSSHPLCNLPEAVLGTILHYMYTESLPENLDESTAQKVMLAISQHTFLAKLSTMCRLFLKNLSLKRQIISLANEMHGCLDKMQGHLNYKPPSGDPLISCPDRLCLAVKQCFRDAAVATIKLIELCTLYTKHRPELTRNEQHEIIRYGKSRFHIFLTQIQRFLQLLKDTFGSMSAPQRNDVAVFLVPEVTGILDMLSQLVTQIESAMERIIAFLDPDDLCKTQTSLGNACTYAMYIKEVRKFRHFSESLAYSLDMVENKRQSFMDMTPSQKIRSISRNIEQLVDEIPILFLIRLEEVTESSDKSFGWRDFKFCFQVGTSKVSSITQLFASHRDELQEVIVQICELVQRDAFNQSLQNLGLLEPNSSSSEEDEVPKALGNHTQDNMHEMNLVESFSISPKANISVLSKNLLESLRNHKDTDMQFEISDDSESKETRIFEAHRVVVASRCNWFRRALLSGMREDIDKKIVIHDTNPASFEILLEYLYSGKLVSSTSTYEQLVDLLILGDKFDLDHLKQVCEMSLEKRVDKENAVYLLSVAENYNSEPLKTICLDFIAQHQDIIESDVFGELPSDLRALIFDRIWTQPAPKKSTSKHDRYSSSISLSDMDTHFSRLAIDTSGAVQHELNRLERSISRMRDVIGPHASRDQLIQKLYGHDNMGLRAHTALTNGIEKNLRNISYGASVSLNISEVITVRDGHIKLVISFPEYEASDSVSITPEY